MSALGMVTLIGTTVSVQEKGFAWFATITDVKESYGTVRLQVTPVAGIGTVWVDHARTRTV